MSGARARYAMIVLLLSSSAWGQEWSGGTSLSFARVAISLLVVLFLIFLLAWLVRRVGQGRYLKPGLIQILGGISLGPKSRVVLLQVEDKRLLLGVTPESITPLLTLSSNSVPSPDFQSLLNQSPSSENAPSRG
jgi:flagellar protein FliO/FliZ